MTKFLDVFLHKSKFPFSPYHNIEEKFVILRQFGNAIQHVRMNQSPTVYSTLRTEASRGGLTIGLLWLVSFVLVTSAFDDPSLGLLGNMCALFSVIHCVRLVRRRRSECESLTFVQCLWYIWLTCFYAALLTTFGQYLYFQWIDNGRFVQGFTRILQDPAYRESLQKMYPEGFNFDEVTRAASALTVRDIVMQLLLTNLFCTTVVAFVAAVLGMLGKAKSPRKE